MRVCWSRQFRGAKQIYVHLKCRAYPLDSAIGTRTWGLRVNNSVWHVYSMYLYFNRRANSNAGYLSRIPTYIHTLEYNIMLTLIPPRCFSLPLQHAHLEYPKTYNSAQTPKAWNHQSQQPLSTSHIVPSRHVHKAISTEFQKSPHPEHFLRWLPGKQHFAQSQGVVNIAPQGLNRGSERSRFDHWDPWDVRYVWNLVGASIIPRILVGFDRGCMKEGSVRAKWWDGWMYWRMSRSRCLVEVLKARDLQSWEEGMLRELHEIEVALVQHLRVGAQVFEEEDWYRSIRGKVVQTNDVRRKNARESVQADTLFLQGSRVQ